MQSCFLKKSLCHFFISTILLFEFQLQSRSRHSNWIIHSPPQTHFFESMNAKNFLRLVAFTKRKFWWNQTERLSQKPMSHNKQLKNPITIFFSRTVLSWFSSKIALWPRSFSKSTTKNSLSYLSHRWAHVLTITMWLDRWPCHRIRDILEMKSLMRSEAKASSV